MYITTDQFRYCALFKNFKKYGKWSHLKFMKYLNVNKLLHEMQSDFRAGNWTYLALILLIDSCLSSINEGKIVGCAMIDFRYP